VLSLTDAPVLSRTVRALAARGVDTRRIARSEQLKTGATISLSTAHDRALLTFPGTIAALESSRIDPAWFAEARHVHVASYFLQPRLASGLADLLAVARRTGATISLDTGWDPAERWDGGLPAVLEQVDIFLPNEIEARCITGLPHVEEALERLAGKVPVVVIKLGAQGAIARRAQEIARVPSLPVEVVDTTGAGDSFDAGFVYGYLQGLPLTECLRVAVACGSLSTRAAGGTTAQPTLAEVLAAGAANGLVASWGQ
jgi:sugar/nucleoside kinase (ribokinase family)